MFSKKNQVLKNKPSISHILVLVFTIISISLIFTNFKNESTYVYILFASWIVMLIYSILDISNRVFILMYLFAFFNFQIGRSILITLGFHVESHFFTLIDSLRGQNIILFSFLIFSIAIVVIDKLMSFNNIENNDYQYNNFDNSIMKKASKHLFYVFYIFMMYSLIMSMRFVFEHGYPSLFLDKTAGVPKILRKLGDIAPFLYLFYLSTMPTKDEIKFPLLLWVIYLFVSLAIGSRFEFVIGLLTMFAYFIVRNYVNRGDKLWVNIKMVVYSGIIGVFLIVGLSIYSETRFGFTAKEKSPIKIFTKFFYDQGINVNNNKRIFKHEYQIPADRIYSFNSMISFYDRNINPLFTGEKLVVGNNLDRAYNQNSMSDMLSVLVLGEEKYLSGLGVGSSYIAEVYHDFGYVGLIIVNNLYAYILLSISKMIRKSPLSFVVGLNIFTAMLKVPRANADLPILYLIDPMLWISTGILFAYKIYLENNTNKKGLRSSI